MSDQHVMHFVGIGGIHMSALAHILLDDGQVVSGCDRIDAPILQPLRERGARDRDRSRRLRTLEASSA